MSISLKEFVGRTVAVWPNGELIFRRGILTETPEGIAVRNIERYTAANYHGKLHGDKPLFVSEDGEIRIANDTFEETAVPQNVNAHKAFKLADSILYIF